MIFQMPSALKWYFRGFDKCLGNGFGCAGWKWTEGGERMDRGDFFWGEGAAGEFKGRKWVAGLYVWPCSTLISAVGPVFSLNCC